MYIIAFKRGKITFQLLLITSFRLSIIICQLNPYDTDQRFQINTLQYDCLNYHIRHQTLVYEDLFDIIDEIIPYCIRPTIDFHELFEISGDLFSEKLSFKELYKINITVQQLLSWSIPMEVAERYQIYLNKPNITSNEYVYNCTSPYFGLQCQYSFEYGEGLSFNEIVNNDFLRRTAHSDSSELPVEVPCYVLLECHRNGQRWCLDWREICDGNIDCIDEGIDEQSCFDLEINECNDNEYQCHNGLCISHEFWENGEGDVDCLDQSDNVIEKSYSRSCFQDPTFRCEEHSCRVSINPFSCGDGQCVPKFQNCPNGRHILLIESMVIKGNLTDECQNAMACLTGLIQTDDQELCEIWLKNTTAVYATFEQCQSFIQFPTIPVYSDYVRFLYKDPHLKLNIRQYWLPDYICYNQQLCDFINFDLVYDNQTCFNATNMTKFLIYSENRWMTLIMTVALYFRSCSTFQVTFFNKVNYTDDSLLYNCQDSSKLIPKYRIMDGFKDCPKRDDENYINSCQLNDQYRIKCGDTTKCWSAIRTNDVCALNGLENTGQIRFQSYCDGIEEYFYDNNEQQYDDELGCENWLCDNTYTHCDGFWTCQDGHDEYNCSRSICPLQTYACISPINYTVICLSFNLVNDETVHCLGALDEQSLCRKLYPSKNYRFRCSDNSSCIRVSSVCNNERDCLQGDDENEMLCKKQQFTCNKDLTNNRSDIEELFCGLMEVENRRTKYFSVHTTSRYPLIEKDTEDEFNHSLIEHHKMKIDKVAQVQNNTWPWYCNRGLVIQTLIENDIKINRTCLCPPSYYGHLCQYQNQRVSVTLRLTSNDRHTIYAVVTMLIDETDERQHIHAYDQFMYIAKYSCSTKLNRYFLYSSRSKNISQNYSLRIDIFEKNKITYVGSWYFPIPFLFLPVNRLSIALNLSNHIIQHSSNYSNKCINGNYVKYVNKDNYFCRCQSKWSGKKCNMPINCETCSSESVCIGSSYNRSICVCPIDRYGRQCLFKSKCPNNACQNNGQCVPADIGIPGNNHTCICSDRYFGHNCEHRKIKLDVSMIDIDIPPYLVAYFFTLSTTFNPIESIILRKLTLFQRIVTFYITTPLELTFIEANNKYYLAVVQQSLMRNISTSISPKQECISTKELLNSTVLNMIPYQRIIYFHRLCYTNHSLICFIDEIYLCLCTNYHHANCMEFNHPRDFTCPINNYCQNDGQCLQNHPTCLSTKICFCPNCFFGSQCQFYAKGLGSTLDEILGYEFKRNQPLFKQPMTVIVASIITILIFLIDIINSILSMITFAQKRSHEVGSGIYLLTSSVTSLCIMILFILKFYFLLYSHQDRKNVKQILEGNCYGIEVLLKGLLYLDNWLNACVASERTVYVIKGITFDKVRSRRIACWTILLLVIIIGCLFIPQIVHLHIFYDNLEERSWCVVKYEKWLAIYSSTLIFIHYFAPLAINIFSIICVIVITTRQRSLIDTRRSYWAHLRSRIIKHRYIFMSSAMIICLIIPYLIISIKLDCQKSSNLFWFYLIGYFLSFLPAAFIFMIFVLPSSCYRKEFHAFLLHTHRRFQIFKVNMSKL